MGKSEIFHNGYLAVKWKISDFPRFLARLENL